MVDNQGDWRTVLAPFKETEWNGVSAADTVFPTFLFIMGVAIPIALSRSRRRGSESDSGGGDGGTRNGGAAATGCGPALRRVFLRSFKMFLIGAAMNLWASGFNLAGFGLMGVLQRIGICYCMIACLYVLVPMWAQRCAVAGCVIVYAAVMYGADVPGCGRGVVTVDCNAGQMIDHAVFGGRMAAGTNNPQGLLSSLSAIATTHAGCEYGCLLRRYRGALRRLLAWWAAAACAMLAGGLAMAAAGIELNKKVWSLSFVCVAGAVSGGALALGLACVDMVAVAGEEVGAARGSLGLGRRCGARVYAALVGWLRAHGRNPLVVFVGMVALEILLLDSIQTAEYDEGSGSGGRTRVSAWAYLYRAAVGSWMGRNAWASSSWALLHVGIWTAVVRALDARKWYITL